MSDNDFREVIDGEENKEPAASDNNLHTTEAESAEAVSYTHLHTVAVNMAMTKERLINSGFYDLATAYQSVHVNY